MSTCLVVDDDPRIRQVLVRVCRDIGLGAVEAGDGEAAKEALAANDVDLVLLDLALPKTDGMAVLRWLRLQSREQQPGVILVTALADVDGKIQGAELGAIDFIEKPFRLPDVDRRLRRALSIVMLERRLQSAERILDKLRHTDDGSGVEPTGRLYEVLEAEFLAARVGGRALSCIVVSDEGYAQALSEAGRPESQARLHALADQIEARLRGADRVFRVDNAEFVLVLPGTPAAGARRVVERIAETVVAEGGARPSHLAIGVASFPHAEISQASQLFRAVNVTLAMARAREQERIVYFEGF